MALVLSDASAETTQFIRYRRFHARPGWHDAQLRAEIAEPAGTKSFHVRRPAKMRSIQPRALQSDLLSHGNSAAHLLTTFFRKRSDITCNRAIEQIQMHMRRQASPAAQIIA
jgi:hypothetical protein